MTYDLLITNGLIVDGSGSAPFEGNIAVSGGTIVGVGNVSGDAHRVIDAEGQLLTPGFIDNHCHYDGQVTFDPLCTFSSFNGVTTVINGNCSLTLAPVRPGDEHELAQMLAKVEAIPLDVLENGVSWGWESFGDYLNSFEGNLGINVGGLVGHSAVRRYIMGEDSQDRQATGEEIEAMQAVVRQSMEAGALGMSFDRNPRHVDMNGNLLPGNVASVDEILALASTLGSLGTGTIQVGDPTGLERSEDLCTRISKQSGGNVAYLSISQSTLQPEGWKEHLAHLEKVAQTGGKAHAIINPRPGLRYFQMNSAEFFNFLPTWKKLMNGPTSERIQAFADAETRDQLNNEVLNGVMANQLGFSGRWDLMLVIAPTLPKNKDLIGKSVAEIASSRGVRPIDAFLDIVVEEELGTWFARNEQNNDDLAMSTMLKSPYTVIGLSDAGAHVVREGGYGYGVHFMSHWVRDRKIMSIEEGIHQLTGFQANFWGVPKRGVIAEGNIADLLVLNLEELGLEASEEVFDLPGNSRRLKQTSRGIPYTIVSGEVLLEGAEHTGVLPGKVVRGSAAIT